MPTKQDSRAVGGERRSNIREMPTGRDLVMSHSLWRRTAIYGHHFGVIADTLL